MDLIEVLVLSGPFNEFWVGKDLGLLVFPNGIWTWLCELYHTL
jgi:hypothetical protein